MTTYMYDGHATDHMRRFPRPSPSILAYCKRSKTGGEEVLGTRINKHYTDPLRENLAHTIRVNYSQEVTFNENVITIAIGRRCYTVCVQNALFTTNGVISCSLVHVQLFCQFHCV